MAYVYLNGNDEVPVGIDEENLVRQALHWIGFNIDAQRDNIFNDGVDSWDSIKMLTVEDIHAMAKSFASRQAAMGRMIFGTNRTKFLKALVNWVQDFYRISETPSIVGLSQTTFRTQLRRAQTRDQVRKTLKEQSAPNDASPGMLEKETKWKEWEEKFINYLRLHLGSSGIPLSYVIRENDLPDTTTVFTDFIQQTVANAPLNGEHFEADKLTVFNFIVSFTTGKNSGDWVKPTVRHQNGRTSMSALRDHFLGEGNVTRSLTEAERLRESLHYKNERSMPFETFLTQCQRMYNIFEQENEPMAEDAKIRFMFKSIHHEKVKFAVESLKAQRTAGTALTYTACCNHLTTAVTELPEYVQKNRLISSIQRGRERDEKGSPSILNEDGTINATGHISDWHKLSLKDKRLVYKERKRLGVKFNKQGGKSKPLDDKSKANTISQLRNQNRNLKRTIKSLKSEPTGGEGDDKASNGPANAGDEFGGKNSKKSKKE